MTLPIRSGAGLWGCTKANSMRSEQQSVTEDDCFAPLTLGKQLEKALPNILFTYVPQAGHLVQNDQPEVVTRMMIEFIRA